MAKKKVSKKKKTSKKKNIPTIEVVDKDTVFVDNLVSPLATAKLRKPSKENVRLCICGDLVDSDAEKVAAFASRFKHSTIVIPRREKSQGSLRFLAHFPFLSGFDLQDENFKDDAELSHLPKGLTSLDVNDVGANKIDLQILENLPKLQSLCIERQTVNIDAIGSLKNLRRLTLFSVTLPDLKCLLPLKKIDTLEIKLGGTTNLDLIPQIGRMRNLELWRIKGLARLDWLSKAKTLEDIFLQDLRNVKKLPSFKSLNSLKSVTLDNVSGLSDLTPIAQAPKLTSIGLFDMKHLDPESLRPFVGHKALRYASISLGSRKKDKLAKEILPLPEPPEPDDDDLAYVL